MQNYFFCFCDCLLKCLGRERLSTDPHKKEPLTICGNLNLLMWCAFEYLWVLCSWWKSFWISQIRPAINHGGFKMCILSSLPGVTLAKPMLNLVADLFNKVLYHLFWLSIVPAPYHRWSLVGSLAKLLGAPLFQEFKCAEIITMSKSILWGRWTVAIFLQFSKISDLVFIAWEQGNTGYFSSCLADSLLYGIS
jgi:hypothetical protein